jgi:Rrf2 family protein
MLNTRESDYALRILRALFSAPSLTVNQICRQENIPEAFAYRIVSALQKAGLIEITRGRSGGCRLAADIADKTLADVFAALQIQVQISDCMDESFACPKKHQGQCVCSFYSFFQEMQSETMHKLQSTLLMDLLEKPFKNEEQTE